MDEDPIKELQRIWQRYYEEREKRRAVDLLVYAIAGVGILVYLAMVIMAVLKVLRS